MLNDLYNALKAESLAPALLREIRNVKIDLKDDSGIAKRIDAIQKLSESLALCSDRIQSPKTDIGALMSIVLDSFREAAQQKIPDAQEGVQVYQYLLELSQVEGTVPRITPPKLSSDKFPFTGVLTTCFEKLEGSNDKDSWTKILEDTKNKIEGLPASPEKQIILVLIEKWLNTIVTISFEVPKIKIQLAPYLGFDEESEKDDTMVPLLLWNDGGSAYGVALTEGGDTQRSQSRGVTHPISQFSTPSDKPIGDNLLASTTRFIYLPNSQEPQITIEVDWKNSAFSQAESKPRLLITRSNEQNASRRVNNLRNPYIPDRVLGAGDPFVGRENLLKELKQIFKNLATRGEMICLWGMRHVGKTSLLYRLQAHMELEQELRDIIPVHINCAIFDRDQSWTHDEFAYFLCRTIQDKLKEYDNEILVNQPTSLQETQQFFAQIGRLLSNKKLAIFFDDADIFSQNVVRSDHRSNAVDQRALLFPDFPERTWKLFENLIDLAQRGGGLQIYFIFATENAIGDLWNGKVKPPAREIQRPRLGFLTPKELKSLTECNDTTPRYDDLAFAYLCRVTGGHPAIAQLVCYHVMKLWCEDRNGPVMVNLSLVRKAVKQTVTAGSLVGYFSYIWQYSLPEKLLDLMERLILDEKERIDPRTLIIDLAGFEMKADPDAKQETLQGAMNRLVDIGFVSETHGQYTLRLGMFYLWTKVWRQLAEEQG